MNWEAFGASAEFLGALAVLATLIYLAVQVKGAREELRHSVEHNAESANLTLILEGIRNPDLAALSHKAAAATGMSVAGKEAIQALGDFTEQEAALLHNYYFAWWLNYSATIGNVDFLSSERRDALEARLRFHYGNGPHKVWFDAYRENVGRDDPAINYVVGLLRDRT